MKIIVGADPLGLELKEKIKKHLIESGHEVVDVGTQSINKPVLYIDAADLVAKRVQSGEAKFGIVICGTGVGVSIIANKHKGIYCVCAESQWIARESRIINNANVLALGGRIVGDGMANDIVDTFIATEWLEGCDERRSKNLSQLFDQVTTFEKASAMG